MIQVLNNPPIDSLTKTFKLLLLAFRSFETSVNVYFNNIKYKTNDKIHNVLYILNSDN